MEICKCFFCGKDILIKEIEKADIRITGSERREFYKKYGYVRYLVGKIGKKSVCNKCKDDIYELISANIYDAIIDMEVQQKIMICKNCGTEMDITNFQKERCNDWLYPKCRHREYDIVSMKINGDWWPLKN